MPGEGAQPDMVEFNRQERLIKVKIAYYGPAVGGKTTNLKVLYDRARGGGEGSSCR